MPNIFFELDKLRVTLINKGLDRNTVEAIVSKASRDISEAAEQHGNAALQQAIQLGVDKRSADFINELRMDTSNIELTTESGNLEFTEPPYPMLSKLLKNAKPMKDGSGVYKIVPVGGGDGNKPKLASNIYDAYKQINAERMENAKRQYASISPKGSKEVQFRTATSKQDPARQWVIPARHNDFTEDMKDINNDLSTTMDDAIRDIIQNYEEGF